MDKIILYTINCPKCNVLEKKLNAANIEYTKITDENIMIELGIDKLPFPVLKVNDETLLYGDAIKYVNERIN